LSSHGNSLELWLSVNCLIKLVVNVDRGEWSHLARGTAFLLYSRGVHRYTTAFEHAMLESQLPFVVCAAYNICLLFPDAHEFR
jgi:hypothetical protein